jgi:adenylate cyclase
MVKKTRSAVQLAEQIIQLLQEDGALNDSFASNQDVQRELYDLLVKAGFPERDVVTKNVTILLSDIRGFSDIVEAYPAKEVVRMLNRYFACMGNIITRYNGRIDKLMGDSILVLFGIPTPKASDVERAIACAVEMQHAMTEFNAQNRTHGMPDLFMGIGLNTGTVVVGDLGSEHYNEYTVIGDEVNLTSRIEAHCLRGQILISEKTYQRAKDYVQVGVPNLVEVKGARDALNLYELYSTFRPKMMEVPRREGRKSPRIPVKMPVSFQCLNGKIVLPEKNLGQVVDISYNGLLIESKVNLGKFSEIKMSLSLGLFGNRSSDVYARIINTKEVVSGMYRSSMEFTSIDSEGQLAIKQQVDKLLTRI